MATPKLEDVSTEEGVPVVCYSNIFMSDNSLNS